MSIFGTNISLLNKFMKHFSSCFSKKQLTMFTLAVYALFKDYKRNSIDAMAKATHTDYQKLQYFFSDSKLDIQALKHKRLEIIQKQRTTASTKNGLLAIDDTSCPKPFAKKTEGVKLQYCGPLKKEEICNVGVGIAFVSPAKHFPIDIVPYLPSTEFPGGEKNPQFKDKIQIAKELFDKSLNTIDFSSVTFDSFPQTHPHTKEILLLRNKVQQKYLHAPSNQKNTLSKLRIAKDTYLLLMEKGGHTFCVTKGR